MPIRSLKVDELQPHPSEIDTVNRLAELRCRFAIDAEGRVHHILVSRGFSDQNATLLEELPHPSQFCGGYHPPGRRSPRYNQTYQAFVLFGAIAADHVLQRRPRVGIFEVVSHSRGPAES